jgi:preprotein translocase subunit YajC
MANVQLILLQAQGGAGSYMQFGFIALMIGVFYFFMIRPQQKKAKDQEKFRSDLKPGDRVQTIGGLHGTIASIESDGTIILIVDRIRMKFEKTAIQGISTKAE